MKCKKYPKYKGIRKPTKCQDCYDIYLQLDRPCHNQEEIKDFLKKLEELYG